MAKLAGSGSRIQGRVEGGSRSRPGGEMVFFGGGPRGGVVVVGLPAVCRRWRWWFGGGAFGTPQSGTMEGMG
jgi:hypothetical protein